MQSYAQLHIAYNARQIQLYGSRQAFLTAAESRDRVGVCNAFCSFRRKQLLTQICPVMANFDFFYQKKMQE